MSGSAPNRKFAASIPNRPINPGPDGTSRLAVDQQSCPGTPGRGALQPGENRASPDPASPRIYGVTVATICMLPLDPDGVL